MPEFRIWDYNELVEIAKCFASRDPSRKGITEPHHFGTKLYATDGRMAVEIETGRTTSYLSSVGDEPAFSANFPDKGAVDIFNLAEDECVAGKRTAVALPNVAEAIRNCARNVIENGDVFSLYPFSESPLDTAMVLFKLCQAVFLVNAEFLRRIVGLFSETDEPVVAHIPNGGDPKKDGRKPLYFKTKSFRALLMPLHNADDQQFAFRTVASASSGQLLHSCKYDAALDLGGAE